MAITHPLVSIAITTFNRARLVRRAIDSAINQTYRNLEIIVVDDGSTDDTAAVLRSYAERDARIRLVLLPINRGINGAKNCALDSVSGEFTTLLDSDDELLPEAIATLLQMFISFGPEYGMMVCNAVDPHTGAWTGLGVDQDSDLTYQDALCGRWSGDFTSLWRTAVMAGLRFATDEAAREVNVWTQLYQRCKVRYQHTAVRNYYRDTPGSAVAIRYDQRSAQRRMAAALSYVRMFGADVRRHCPRNLAAPYREIVLYASLAGRRAIAMKSAVNAVRLDCVAANLRLIVVPLLPRFLFVWLLRRHFAARGAKLS